MLQLSHAAFVKLLVVGYSAPFCFTSFKEFYAYHIFDVSKTRMTKK